MGVARYIGAAFLMVWLAGWVVGEAVAIIFLVMLIRSVLGSLVGVSWPVPGGEWIAGGAAGFFFLFLVIWLALWTVGGFAAITHLLRSLAGEDLVTVRAGDVELVRRAGPFRRVRTLDRSRIRRVRIRRHDHAVVIDTASGTEPITAYGTRDERQGLAEWLQRQLALPDDGRRIDTDTAPPGWLMRVEGNAARLTRMDPQAHLTGTIISWAIAAFTGLIWYGSTTAGPESGSAIALALTLLLACWAAWVTWSHREWLVSHDELTWHRRFATWKSTRSFKSAQLEVVISTDSDNDDHYELKVVDGHGKKRISSEMNDHASVVDLGQWLSARTGFALTLPSSLQTRTSESRQTPQC